MQLKAPIKKKGANSLRLLKITKSLLPPGRGAGGVARARATVPATLTARAPWCVAVTTVWDSSPSQGRGGGEGTTAVPGGTAGG